MWCSSTSQYYQPLAIGIAQSLKIDACAVLVMPKAFVTPRSCLHVGLLPTYVLYQWRDALLLLQAGTSHQSLLSNRRNQLEQRPLHFPFGSGLVE